MKCACGKEFDIPKFCCECGAQLYISQNGKEQNRKEDKTEKINYVLPGKEECNTDDFGVFIGPKIREIRKDKGISQRFVQKKINKYESWLSQVESGEVQLYAKELPCLANALGVRIEDFFIVEPYSKLKK